MILQQAIPNLWRLFDFREDLDCFVDSFLSKQVVDKVQLVGGAVCRFVHQIHEETVVVPL